MQLCCVADQLESAVMDSDPQGPLCDLIQMLLCALFNLQEEEAEEYQELEKEEKEEMEKKPNTGLLNIHNTLSAVRQL